MNADAAAPVRVPRQLVQLNMDRDLVATIDELAVRARWTRTDWITEAVLAYLPPEVLTDLGIDRP